jgi:hypothetical protein
VGLAGVIGMAGILAFVSVLAFLVWTLLAPSTLRDTMQRNIRREARTPEANLTRFATMVIFFVGIGLFYEIGQRWPAKVTPHLETFALWSSAGGAVFLLIAGAFACLRPMQLMRLFNRHLRGVPNDRIDPKSRRRIVMVAKAFGVMLLLASSCVVHQVAEYLLN